MSNSARKIGFAEFEAATKLGSEPGSYFVEYYDSTHCPKDTWVRLLEIRAEAPAQALVGSENSQVFFTLKEAIAPQKSGDEKAREKNAHTLSDTLAQVLVRTGILRPKLTDETLREIFELSNSPAVFLVPDTNALSSGTLHWLLQALSGTHVWMLPAVVSLTQIQQRDALLKSLVRRGKPTDQSLGQALRSRAFVNASLSLLERHRERYEVLEVDPELLRYLRPAGSGTGDSDQGDILEDRLLIEAIHAAVRSTRSQTQKRVVTSDVLLARIFRTEGLPTVFLQIPPLPHDEVPCFRYEPLARSFLGATLPRLLWEATHAFASTRLVDASSKEIARLDAYWPEKTLEEWAGEVLSVEMKNSNSSMGGAQGRATDTDGLAENADLNARSAGKHPTEMPVVGDGLSAMGCSASKLPEVAFPQVVRVGSALLDLEGGTPEDLRSALPDTGRPSLEITKLAAEVLLRCGLATLQTGRLVKTSQLETFFEDVQRGRLDAASALLETWPAYKALIEVIKRHSSQKLESVPNALLRQLRTNGANKGAERLCRYPVFLGQAWTDRDRFKDGSNRPADDVLRANIVSAFDKHQKDGLCPVRELLLTVCSTTRMTPWAVGIAVQRLVSDGKLSELSFQPSLGSPSSSRDEIITRSQDGDIQFVPIPVDRLQVNGRPVFTVSRGHA